MVDISQGMACIYRRIIPVYESSKEKGQICAKPTTSKHSRESKQSYAKLNMTEKRSHMHPETLQLIMILKLKPYKSPDPKIWAFVFVASFLRE